MSSCQDSMDTDDSIPRPEYEDIVPGEEDDEKFWEEKSKSNFSAIENGTQQQKRDTANLPPADSPRSSPPSTISPGSNSNQSFLGKDCDEPMEEDCEYDETSFDEADEKDEIDDKSCNTPVQSNEDPLEIRERVKEVVTPASITTDGTDSPVPHIKTGENKSTVLINLNGEIVMRRSSAKPSTSTPINTLSRGLTPEEDGISLVDQIKRSHLSQFKDERRRSKTPSRRGTREIMALQKSFTESKVLSEFVNEKERPRKSRKIPLKDATIIDDGERQKFNLFRARSKSLTKSNLRPIAFSTTTNSLQRWPSEGKLNSKRENMRSQNTDFVQKQMKFLNRVNQDDPMSDASEGEPSLNESIITGSLENKDDCWQPPPKSGADSFCWKCGKSSVAIACSKCPRSYHYKCVKVSSASKLDKVWICPECVNLEICINRLKISKKETLSVDMLNQLLLFALKRMKQIKGHEKLLDIPDSKDSPFYEQYVVNPVTLNTLQEKIEKKVFRCTEEFVLETKWIHHNISIASGAGNSKESLVAKAILKVCRQEAAEIETCPECYLNANSHGDWFVDVCLQPHILLWAKLKGFPFWPAKGMGVGPNNLVNVRFFGAHDRAFVPIKDCFLYSEIDPSPQSGKRPFRSGVAACIKEVNVHIQKIKEKIGGFNFAPVRTQYDPVNEIIQLEEMMPGVTEYIKRQQTLQKPPLTYKIVKTAGNNLSFIKKPDSGTESDHSSLGAERNQKRSRSSTQSPKPSPLGEVKKPKELQNAVQSTQLKSSPISKNIGNKSLSLNYEVVAKPGGKDESNSSKINSVILKRKSDVVLIQPNVKKSRSSEGNSGQETPTPKQEKPEIKPEQKKEPAVIPPVVFQCESQKPATEQGQCPEQFPKLDTSTLTTMSKGATNTTATCDMAKLIQNRQGVTIKKVSKKQSGLSSFFTVLSEQTSKNTSDEMLKADTETGIQINTSQQAIAKVVVQPSKCIQSPPNPANSPPKPNQSPPKSNDASSKPVSSPPKYIPSFQKPAASSPKPISSPPKPISSPPKPVSSPPKPPSSSSSPKQLSTPSKSVLMPLKSVSIASVTKQSPIATLKYVQTSSNPTPVVEKLSHPKGLIPFEDIKQEKLDEELLPIKQSKSAKTAIDPLAKTPNGSTSNSSSPKSSTGNSQLDINQLPIPVNLDLIKQENNSDEFPSINSTSSQCKLNPSTALTKTQVAFRPTEQPALTEDNNLKQRLVVRSIESLTMKSTPTKSVTSDYMTSLSTSATSTIITATTTTSGQPKKANARARKSFPNKGPNATTVMLPPEIGRSLTKNSMVFIPVDSQNAVPIQPLTAVSKPTNHNQTVAKVTSSLPITASNSAQNNSTPTITTSTSTLPQFTVIPASTSITPASVTVSAALTNSTISVSATVTGVSSALATYRPSNVSTVKTLSPLQLTVQPVPTPALETGNTSDKNREAEGHILSGIVTPSLAAAITNTIVRGPPKLAPRPNGALRSYGNYGFNSEAGPVCRTLVENAHKMTDFFISVMQDTVNDMASADVLQAKVAALQMELETKVASYEKQLYELKQNTDTMLCEMKKSMETERMRIIAETRQQCEIERIHAVEQTKRRQWCACCGREANSYCCWNTAYCNTNCQATDWLRHKLHCCQVNPHLNPELQGPGILFSAPNLNTAPSTITTTTDQMISCTAPSYMPHQPVQILRTGQSTTASIPSSSSVQTATATTIQKKSGSPSSAGASTSASATSSTTIDMAYKNKEVLKLPPNTYLRPLQPSMRFPSPSVHRFNISVPITSGTTGGAPIKLVQREGTWELMSVPHPSSTVIPQLSSYKQQQQQQQQQQLQQHQQQPPRLINNSLTANLPKDSRTLGSVMVRSNQM